MIEKYWNRYNRNKTIIDETEQRKLAGSRVCVAGCGGLGGSVIENLVRLGVGQLTVIDGDSFDETNLNRQVLSHEGNLGHAKAIEAKLQMAQINSEVFVTSVQTILDEENAADIIAGHDLVVDALDNISSRLVLEDACHKEKIPLVHGAIDGWNGQVTVSMPGSWVLHEIYGESLNVSDDEPGLEDQAGEGSGEGNLSFAAAIVAGIEAAEALKLLLGRETRLKNYMLVIDLMNHEYEQIQLK